MLLPVELFVHQPFGLTKVRQILLGEPIFGQFLLGLGYLVLRNVRVVKRREVETLVVVILVFLTVKVVEVVEAFGGADKQGLPSYVGESRSNNLLPVGLQLRIEAISSTTIKSNLWPRKVSILSHPRKMIALVPPSRVSMMTSSLLS